MPLSHVASLSFVLVVNPSVEAKSLKELIELVKAKPMFFGSSGNGGLPHLTGELLNLQAGIHATHVAYRGSAPAITDLIGGQVAAALRQPDVAERAAALGLELVGSTPEQFGALQRSEIVNWGDVVRTVKIQMD